MPPFDTEHQKIVLRPTPTQPMNNIPGVHVFRWPLCGGRLAWPDGAVKIAANSFAWVQEGRLAWADGLLRTSQP